MALMDHLFDRIEPLTIVEQIVRYWHFLRSLDGSSRAELGPLTLFVEANGSVRGWPIGLKNQTLALSTEAELSSMSAVIFVDLSRVVVVGFDEVHRVLPFITSGAVSRSPLEEKPTRAAAQNQLLRICEDLKLELPAKIFFDRDPTLFGIDDVLNLNEFLTCFVGALRRLRSTRKVDGELSEVRGLHIINAPGAKDISLGLSDGGEMELSLSFSRALPSNLAEQIDSLLVSIF